MKNWSKRVDYESLEVTHHDDMRQVDEIVNLIL